MAKVALDRRITRLSKIARQRIHVARHGRPPAPRPIFVLGSQRSGTRLPLVVFERAPDVITHTDGSTPFFNGVMLHDDRTVARLLARQLFPIVVVKPICESHRALEFLSRFPDARVIWIFRAYTDAVNSVSAKWRSGVRALGYLASGDLARAAWRAGGLTPEKLALTRELYHPEMSLHAANAVLWHLRNALYLDQQLDERPDALLVRYEDLVREPHHYFPRLFAFAGSRYEPAFAADVYDSSVGRSGFPAIPDRIRDLCEDTHRRLMTCYERQRA